MIESIFFEVLETGQAKTLAKNHIEIYPRKFINIEKFQDSIIKITETLYTTEVTFSLFAIRTDNRFGTGITFSHQDIFSFSFEESFPQCTSLDQIKQVEMFLNIRKRA